MNKIRIPMYITLGAGILFSLFQISFHADISLLAFPLGIAVTFFSVWFLFIKVYRNREYKAVSVSRKLLQYLPYVYLASFIIRRAGKSGTFYWYDVVTVLLWAIVLVSRYFVLHFFKEKRILSLEPSWKSDRKQESSSKPSGMKRVLFEVLDWADAIVQAVFMVLIFQIFVLQLYVIPSESMVPSFLVGDRVIVLKTPSGPKMPLSDVGFPCLKKYKRGDVVVFRNPHYSMDRKSEIRTVASQIVYMLTFSAVNLNVDEKGDLKADPLVKRVCGLPGEQIVMQDGVLYARTKESDEFKAVDFDSKYAAWNLNSVNPVFRRGIQVIPLSQDQYDVMLEVESQRRGLDLDPVSLECSSIAREFKNLSSRYEKQGGFKEPSLYEYDIFADSIDESVVLLKTEGGAEWFSSFMTDWISKKDASLSALSDDIYAEANYRLNLMIKLTAGRIYLRSAELYSQGKSLQEISSDSRIAGYFETAEKLHFYVMILDQRNMPVFPENTSGGKPQFIGEYSYFMMGDNRFNSLDMRHSYEQKKVPLTLFDSFSADYYSNMSPQTVSRKHILGRALYRFWPLARRGVVQTE